MTPDMSVPRDYLELRDALTDTVYEDCLIPEELRDLIKGIIYKEISENPDIREEFESYVSGAIDPERLTEIAYGVKQAIDDEEFIEIQQSLSDYGDAVADHLMYNHPIDDRLRENLVPKMLYMATADAYIRHVVNDFICTKALEESWNA